MKNANNNETLVLTLGKETETFSFPSAKTLYKNKKLTLEILEKYIAELVAHTVTDAAFQLRNRAN